MVSAAHAVLQPAGHVDLDPHGQPGPASAPRGHAPL